MPEPVAERTTASNAAGSPMLSVRGLNAWYGESHILHGVDFDVQSGEVVTLLGRNGAGKTTTLKALVGTIAPWGGRVVFQGEDVTRLPAHAKAARGLVLVPEGRQLFSAMTVEENLEIERAMRPGFQSLQGRRTAQEAVWGLLSLAPKNRFPRARGKRRQRLGSHATETGLHARVPKAIASVIFRYPAPK
jgi:ABC-type branched-subunit amino acid transport system ATPase component